MRNPMHIWKFLVVAVLLISKLESYAQVVAIPDSMFSDCLSARYPQVLIGSQLQTDSAANLTGTLDLSGYGISNLQGIEYFVNVDTFILANNHITSWTLNAPSAQVKYIDLQNNQMNSCSLFLNQLQHLKINNNKFFNVNYVSALSSLITLDIRNNNITFLPSLSQPNLQHLFADSNALTSLPPLNNIPLKVFTCSHNQITVLSPLSDSLVVLNCEYNKLTAIPATLLSKPNLNILKCDHNDIATIPNLSGLNNLETAEFRDNQLTYEDMIPQMAHPSFSTVFNFNQQNYLKVGYPITVIEGDSLLIRCPIDTNTANLQYILQRNGGYIDQIANSTGGYAPLFAVPDISLADSGNYQFRIVTQLPVLSSFNLLTTNYHVTVTPCIQTDSILVKYTAPTCILPGGVEIDSNSVSGFNPPFTFQLRSSSTNEIINNGSTVFDNLKDPVYNLIITDNKGCSKEKTDFIVVPKPPANCNKIVFTPNGDNLDDNLFIKGNGMAKIYNSKGKLIREISAPGFWDGTDSNGLVPPGYYVIKVNEEVIQLTVIH
jgi:Leucine-rich repeat (LRR) protein